MRVRPLRGQKGLRPYAHTTPFAASRLTGVRYPKSSDDFERLGEIASFDVHDEIENVAANAAAKAVEDFSLGMNEEAWMSLSVKRAKPDILRTGAPKPRVLRRENDKVAAGLHIAGGNVPSIAVCQRSPRIA